ncbi:proteinase inhibitor I4 serpin [Streptomyces sp. S3(2020)]|uniref:serpin family protein n=1 Tax=Streptomyces sp. S3(2020) TaxID=2732044 RepID=UPI001487CD3B|nr:serpin family protein [Streptomyces sp. S3(2020)]NNN36365.1 proteinase inhibitor I4 serpin [Streptomyces sp. S3(2020)]
MIDAVNGLTARWAGSVETGTVEGGTVFSAAGVWPLLAFLADGATGGAREELAEALGVPAELSAAAARELLATMADVDGLDSALGLWTKRSVELREAWEEGLPAAAHGVLTGDPDADQEALDSWAAKRTGGAIGRMPVTLGPDSSLVLATALTLRTDWEVPFTGGLVPWCGQDRAGLSRTDADLDAVAVARTAVGAVTEARVRGTDGVDVHLLLGDEESTPGQVLGAGVDILSGAVPAVPGSRLPFGAVGPGLRIETVRTERPEPPSLTLDTVRFVLAADHDLLARPDLFGLATASDRAPGHFPGISPAPLALAQGRQSATAIFGAQGFRAAAVTAYAMDWMGWEPEPKHESKRVRARFDRPFGFLAVHRRSRLVLAAGWVTDPAPLREDDHRPTDR